jgi:hypothetical protein
MWPGPHSAGWKPAATFQNRLRPRQRRRGSAGASFRPTRVKGCRRVGPVVPRGGSQGGEPGASEPSRDHRAAMMASGHDRRRGRRHHAVRPHPVQPRERRRQGHATLVEMPPAPQLAARIRVEHAVGLAHGPAAACLPCHGPMPRRPLPASAVAVGGVHPDIGHRGPLHDDRLLGTRFPDRGDRRDRGGDRGSDDKSDGSHRNCSSRRGAGNR